MPRRPLPEASWWRPLTASWLHAESTRSTFGESNADACSRVQVWRRPEAAWGRRPGEPCWSTICSARQTGTTCLPWAWGPCSTTARSQTWITALMPTRWSCASSSPGLRQRERSSRSSMVASCGLLTRGRSLRAAHTSTWTATSCSWRLSSCNVYYTHAPAHSVSAHGTRHPSCRRDKLCCKSRSRAQRSLTREGPHTATPPASKIARGSSCRHARTACWLHARLPLVQRSSTNQNWRHTPPHERARQNWVTEPPASGRSRLQGQQDRQHFHAARPNPPLPSTSASLYHTAGLHLRRRAPEATEAAPTLPSNAATTRCSAAARRRRPARRPTAAAAAELARDSCLTPYPRRPAATRRPRLPSALPASRTPSQAPRRRTPP